MDSFEKKHERGINNMGELLLKGYIMTAEACPVCNCPFFKKTSTSPPFCPLCDDKEKKENDKTKKDQKTTITEKNNQQITTKDNTLNDLHTDNTKISSYTSKKDSINSKMSELLLAGWTLTNDNCPFCIGVPLMKNKEKQQFCVKCEKHFISEEEANKQGMAIKNGKIENIKQEEKQQNSLLSESSVQQNNNIKHTLDNEVAQSVDKEIIPPFKKEKVLSLNPITEEAKLECSKTSAALIHQLSSLRSKLEVINENNETVPNTQYTINICDAISSVVKAINACNSVLNN